MTIRIFPSLAIVLLSLAFVSPAQQSPLTGSGKALPEEAARALVAQGRFAEAARAYQLAMKMYLAEGRNLEAAQVESEMGDLYLSTNERKKALRNKLAALKRFQAAGDANGSVRAEMAAAAILFEQGRLEDGAKYLNMARIAARNAISMDDDDRGTMASLCGWEAQLSGATEDAVAGFRRALTIWTAAHGSEHPYVGWGHLLLGDALANVGRDRDALQELQQAIAILGATVSRSDAHYVTAVNAYARELRATGSKTEAAALSSAFR